MHKRKRKNTQKKKKKVGQGGRKEDHLEALNKDLHSYLKFKIFPK